MASSSASDPRRDVRREAPPVSTGDSGRSARAQQRLAEILVEAGLARREEIVTLFAAQRPDEVFSETVARLSAIGDEQIAEALARHYRLPFVRLPLANFDPEALALLTEEQAMRYLAIPIGFDEDGTVVLAVADPLDYGAKQAVEFQGRRVRLAVATPVAIRDAIAARYHPVESLEEMLREVKEPGDIEVVAEPAAGEPREGVVDLRRQEAQPVVKTVNVVLRDAIERRASDVHFEPAVGHLRVRFRVDGVLQDQLKLPKWTQSVVAARLKVLAGLDIAERRLPQDGRFRMRLGPREIDVRVSTLPTHYGEKVVVRLLDPKEAHLELLHLGFEGEQLRAIREAIERPQGMILVTGPTGSGKSSTLFACLRELKNRPLNIVTVENPIEYELPGLNQVQVNEKAGLTFAATLKSILRQDPNVILVGEIRDRETAETAMQAAMTGHLVFSSLHTNDAPSAITRLLDLGVPNYLIATTLVLVTAQRLVRKICRECKVPDRPDPRLLRGLSLPVEAAYYRGAGCAHCFGTGFYGRTVVSETIPIDRAMRDLIHGRDPEGALRKAARAAGLATIVEDAGRKVRAGVTAAEEVVRVVEIPGGEGACPRCGGPLETDFAACPRCGFALRVSCEKCGQPLAPAWSVCPYCRALVARGASASKEIPLPANAPAPLAGMAPALPRAGDLPDWVPSAGAAEASDGIGPAPPPPVPAAPAAVDGADPMGGVVKVLVADDDGDIRQLVTLLLKKLRYRTEVRTARSGAEALAEARRDPPGLVILDIRMPELDGFEVCRQLRQDLATAFIPVLMMTAGREEETRATAFRVGTDDYIAKPIDPAAFKKRVERLIERTYGL